MPHLAPRYSYSILQYSPPVGGTDSTGQNVSALPIVVQLMLDAADELAEPSAPFYYDLVDLTRQLLSDIFNDLYALSQNATAALRASSLTPLTSASLGLLKDLDALLATNQNYLLGQWISRARSWATESEAEADQFEFNARNQLTLWGPVGEINDYAAKHWAGLVGDYYYMRWQMYYGKLVPFSSFISAINLLFRRTTQRVGYARSSSWLQFRGCTAGGRATVERRSEVIPCRCTGLPR